MCANKDDKEKKWNDKGIRMTDAGSGKEEPDYPEEQGENESFGEKEEAGTPAAGETEEPEEVCDLKVVRGQESGPFGGSESEVLQEGEPSQAEEKKTENEEIGTEEEKAKSEEETAKNEEAESEEPEEEKTESEETEKEIKEETAEDEEIEKEETEKEEAENKEIKEETAESGEKEEEKAKNEETEKEKAKDEEPEEEKTENAEAEEEKEKSRETEEEKEENKETKEESGKTEEEEEEIGLPETILPEPSCAFFDDISVFCFSQQGESHLRKNVPCQDRSGFKVAGGRILIAAVADGVGSCALSDYGAETAVNSSLGFLEQYFVSELKKDSFKFDDPVRMGSVLRDMMRFAYESVEKRAEELEQLLYSFQSTLTVAVYDGNTLYFAHAGDDGIVALNKAGVYALVTSRHKGEEASSVYPLQSQKTWQFGKVDDTVAFVMATDGVLDAFVGLPAENNRVYYPFVEPVFYAKQTNEEEAEQICSDWYEYMASPSYRASVTDDLSFVGVVNQKAIQTSVRPVFEIEEWDRQSKEYQKKRREALYPSRAGMGEKKKADPGLSEPKNRTAGDFERPSGTPRYERGSAESPFSRGQMEEAAKWVKDKVAASASLLHEGMERAVSCFREPMDQKSEESGKKNLKDWWSDLRDSGKKD